MMTNRQFAEKNVDVETEEYISSMTQGLSSNTKSHITIGSIGMVQEFGITKQQKFIATARMQKSIAKEERYEYIATGQTVETDNDYVQ